MSYECVIIMTTIDNKDAALNIARKLIESGLAGCVQVDNVSSIYKWNDKMEESNEYRVMIKCAKKYSADARNMITSIHTYQIPELIEINIDDGSDSYLKWIVGQ